MSCHVFLSLSLFVNSMPFNLMHLAKCFDLHSTVQKYPTLFNLLPSQVSKSAPTGEYLSTGSFMIRGKKNYLPPSHLILGFGILFKLGDDCLENHKNERRVRTLETEVSALSLSTEDTQSTVCYLFLKSKFFLSFVPFYYVGKLLVQRKANDLIFILIHFKMR